MPTEMSSELGSSTLFFRKSIGSCPSDKMSEKLRKRIARGLGEAEEAGENEVVDALEKEDEDDITLVKVFLFLKKAISH